MRRTRNVEVREANDTDPCRIEPSDAGDGQRLVSRDTGRQTLPLKQLREQQRRRIIESTATANAQNHFLCLPLWGREETRSWSGPPSSLAVGVASPGSESTSAASADVLMIGQIVDEGFDRGHDFQDSDAIERAAAEVFLRQFQSLERNLVIVSRQWPILHEAFGLFRSFLGVAGQKPLIEVLSRGEGRPVSEDDVEKFELIDMPAEDDQTDGERRRHQQSDRPPQSRPKGGGNHDRKWGEAARVAINHRLDDLTDEQFQTEDQARGPDRQRPPRVYRRGDQDRQYCADEGADVGNEAEHPRQALPKGWDWARL